MAGTSLAMTVVGEGLKLPALIILYCVADFILGVHHEGTVFGDRLAQRRACDHQKPRALTFRLDMELVAGRQNTELAGAHSFAADPGITFEDVDEAIVSDGNGYIDRTIRGQRYVREERCNGAIRPGTFDAVPFANNQLGDVAAAKIDLRNVAGGNVRIPRIAHL